MNQEQRDTIEHLGLRIANMSIELASTKAQLGTKDREIADLRAQLASAKQPAPQGAEGFEVIDEKEA